MNAGKIVFFDLETAGRNPKRHPIIQIAAVAVAGDLETLETFQLKVQFDQARANRNALRKNHYSRGKWANEAVKPLDAARSFAEFLRRHATVPMLAADGQKYHVAQLAAHNAGFDGPFLQAWYAKLGIFLPAKRHVLCTMQRAMWLAAEQLSSERPPGFKLATLCQHFGIAFHAADAHEALADVQATLSLYRQMLSSVRASPLALAG
jgi:exodeoxyribonuclease-1